MEIECYLADNIIFKQFFKGGIPILENLRFIPLEPIYLDSEKGKKLTKELLGHKLKIKIERC